MESQNKLIKKHLEDGHTITAIEALEMFKCFRLASRISDLKQAGCVIDSQFIEVESGKKVKEYWIAQ
tara:strand:- start:1414 stop:1614 length:201 start_codon:yes stop_codon:yes gene_type:complete